MQSKAVQIDQVGGPEELKYRNIIIDAPTKGQVLIKHEAIGLNYIDIMQRNGNHPLAFKNFPVTLGMEAAGIIEKFKGKRSGRQLTDYGKKFLEDIK